MEEEKPTDKHEERQCTKGDGEISPALVVLPPTTWWCTDIAGEECVVTAVVRNELKRCQHCRREHILAVHSYTPCN